MHIAILGRQPTLGIAELERQYTNVSWFSSNSATFDAEQFSIEQLGGTQKAGRIVIELPHGDWLRASMKIVQTYEKKWHEYEGKITLGISAYGFNVDVRDIQKTGLIIKNKLKGTKASLRLIPNQEMALNSAASHHNKLGLSDNKVELLVIRNKDGKIIVAESTGAQNITALAARDQGRPKRDAFVGMLPPKLAQIMINLAGIHQGRLLDPFCGTGVILQEGLLMGYDVFGSDLSEKMIAYTEENIQWLNEHYHFKNQSAEWTVGDAMDTVWKTTQHGKSQPLHIDAVVCEGYLGQPFSAAPSSSKLTEVRGNCNYIMSQFLKNIGTQIPVGTPLCVAVPAWQDEEGGFTHLPLIGKLKELGYKEITFKTIANEQLLYYREDQIVARELLVLEKI